MKSQIAAVLIFGTLTAYGQKPTTVPPIGAKPPAATVEKAKAQAAPAPAPAEPATASVKPEDVKALKDGLALLQLDQLAVQQAKTTFAQTDQVSKKAMEILNQALAASPEVQKATTQEETDRKALLAKIDALRKEQKLDQTWDWDFNRSQFVKTGQPAPAATPATPVPAPASGKPAKG